MAKGYIYFISDGHCHIKIGVTESLERRLKELQTGNANKLKLVHSLTLDSIKDAYELESLLHNMFRSDWVSGEWFMEHRVMKWLKHNWMDVGRFTVKGIGYPLWKIALFSLIVIAVAIITEFFLL